MVALAERGLGIRTALDRLSDARGLSLRDRREFRKVANDDLFGQLVVIVHGDEIEQVALPSNREGALSALGDGTFLQFFEKVFNWLLDEGNRDKIKKLIEWFLSLGSLFGALGASGGGPSLPPVRQ